MTSLEYTFPIQLLWHHQHYDL
uniref:Uncharacterized protein n=1 Tax=Arundo donax TaxID=35708 RepID=A0A0A9AN31_ARUDO